MGFLNCHAQCPPDFKYTISGQNVGGRCVYSKDNSVFFDLEPLQLLQKDQDETPVFDVERKRVAEEVAKALRKVAEGETTKTDLHKMNTEKTAQAVEYTRIQGEYAAYSPSSDALKTMKEVTQSLKPFRPPTAPSSDIERERKAILSLKDQSLLMVQVALFVIVLVMVTYVVIPGNTAHTIAFFIIVTGIAFGFFLRK